jgi:hypothetical protein
MATTKDDFDEGPQAFERFRKALKTVMAVPKDALPPRPTRKKKRAAKSKASTT